MNATQIAQIVALAESLIPLGANLIQALRNAGIQTKTVEELLAEANANADKIIETAQKELNPPAQ